MPTITTIPVKPLSLGHKHPLSIRDFMCFL